MCRIGSIKSLTPVGPRSALELMLPQQEGHDNSGFAMVMQDLAGPFAEWKDRPLLSAACSREGMRAVDDYMAEHHFSLLFSWTPKYDARPGLDIRPMERYLFRVYDYPPHYRYSSDEEKAALLLDTRLALRSMLEKNDEGFVYSFWPDTLTLKEIGDPRDIAT